MKYLVMKFGDEQVLALAVTDQSTPLPELKIIESDVDTEKEGFRSIFQLAEAAPSQEWTSELQACVLRSLYDYITEEST